MAYAEDLKSFVLNGTCGFDPHPGHFHFALGLVGLQEHRAPCAPRVPRLETVREGAGCHWLSAQNVVSIFARAGAAHMPEYSRKVLLRFEAAGHGNIQDARPRRAQHLLRPLDSVA
jgi:hypothetical protein